MPSLSVKGPKQWICKKVCYPTTNSITIQTPGRRRPDCRHQEVSHVTTAHWPQNAVLSLAGFSASCHSGSYHNLSQNISFCTFLLFAREGTYGYPYVHMEARSWLCRVCIGEGGSFYTMFDFIFLQLTGNSWIELDLLTDELPRHESLCPLPLPTWGYQVVARHTNSEPHTCAAGTLPTSASCKSKNISWWSYNRRVGEVTQTIKMSLHGD